MHQQKRFISFLLVVSILLSTLCLPTSATETLESTASNMENTSVLEENAAVIESSMGVPIDFENEAILQHVDQEVFRASNHIRRLPEEETLDTYVYLNQDGSKSVYFMEENVKYVDSDGKVQNKDISLKEIKNGFTTVQNDVSVFIPTNAVNGIQVSHTIGNLKLIPEGSLIVVTGKQDGNSVLYANYFGKGMSLRYTPLLSGVKEDIILASYTGKNSFQFALYTNGLFVYEDAEEGYYVAASQDAEDRYYLGEILVYDAVGRPSMGTMSVKTVTAGTRYILTVTADPTFLTDADTVYPVTIDPTITIGGANDTNKQIWDVPIFSGYPTWTCGAYQYLTLGNAGGNYGVGQAVIKLPGLCQSTIYNSIHYEQINSVYFYCSDGSGNSAQFINLYTNTGNSVWTETNASWNSIGNAYDTSINWGMSMPHEVWCGFNITALVRGWKRGIYNEGCGFRLVHSDETTREKHKAIHSSEYATTSYRPFVVMTYMPWMVFNEQRAVITVNQIKSISAIPQPNNTITWESSDPTVATVNSNGEVTGKKLGMTVIKASAVTSDGELYENSCVVYVAPLHEGVYNLTNKQSRYCADIDGQVMENGITIRQWKAHGGDTQRWIFTYLGDGYYSIKSANSATPYYLGVINDSAGLNVNIVLRTGTLTDGMKWKVERTDSGAYKLTPKTGESSNYVLATTTSNAENGANLIQGAYVYNNSYRDEWYITPFFLDVDLYYDNAFNVRYENATELLNQMIWNVEDIFLNSLNLRVNFNTPTMMISTPDLCKINRGIAITSSTIDNETQAICPANPSVGFSCDIFAMNTLIADNCENCTSRLQIYRDFIASHEGTETAASVIFTGNRLYNDDGTECNRSFQWYNYGVCMQQIFSNSSEYYTKYLDTMVHELAHIVGAPDHYHEVVNGVCKNKERCYQCNSSTGRPEWCLMDDCYINPNDYDAETIFCDACINDIQNHLKSGHYN